LDSIIITVQQYNNTLMQMKKLLLLLAAVISIGTAFAQVPQKLSYEAIVRDSAFVALDSVQVGIKLSIVSDTAYMGSALYTETHMPTTSANGLVQLLIGSGTSTDTFSNINWADGPYYLMTKIDPAGGTDYSIQGATKLSAVPYAHYAGSATTADTAGRASSLNFRVSYQGDSLVMGDGSALILPGLSESNPSFPMGFVHCDPANLTIIETVTSTTGEIWMDRNLGASRVADSSTDSMAYGDLYQWGRSADGHQCRESDTTSVLASTAASSPDSAWYGKFIVLEFNPFNVNDWLSTQDSNLWQGVNGINNPCPTGFRLPTATEWNAEIDKWEESGNKNSTGAYNSPLKLPFTGYRDISSGDMEEVGSIGYYWSSSVSGDYANHISFASTAANLDPLFRAYVNAVRCIKDQP
jgi:uncharacterized protein (TIGR02145 family)